MTATTPAAPVATVDVIRIVWEPDPTSACPDAERCEAIAEVSYPCGSAGERRIEYFRSGGLNEIDAPSPEYRREIEDQEIAELTDHLAVFRVEVPGVLVIENRTRL